MIQEEDMLDEGVLLRMLGLPVLSRPHQLVRQGDDLLVAIASVEGLDAALAAAPPPALELKGGGVLRGYVLPTASTKDCLLLKAAADAGMYGGTTRFSLADHAVVDAKIGARADVDQARAQLADAVSSLSHVCCRELLVATTTHHAPPDQTSSTGGGGASLLAAAEWEATVECTKREVHQLVESTMAHIKALSERLDSA